MIFRGIVLILLAVWGPCAIAQYVKPVPPSQAEQAMISYSDGSNFHGLILSKDSTKWPFVLSTGDTISLDPEQVTRMLLESEAIFFSKQRYHTKRGLFINSNLSFHAGWESSVLWDGMVGASISEKFDLGLGLGISGHDLDMGHDWVYNEFVNAYGYGRYFLNRRFLRLYLDSRVGYAFPFLSFWDNRRQAGGVYLQPGFGIMIASKSCIKWNLGLSQYISNTTGTSTSWVGSGNPIEVDYDIWYNRTMLQFGVSLVIIPRQLREVLGIY